MPSLTVNNLRNDLRAELATDNAITGAEAQAVIGKYKGAVSDAQIRKIVRQELNLSNFPSKQEAADALKTVGLTTSEIGSGSPSGLMGKLGSKLKGLVSKEIYKKRDVQLVKLDLGDVGAIGLKAQTTLVSNRDPLVAQDKFRKAETERRVADGQSVTWASLGGGIFPGASMSTSIPLGASALELTAGFSANASLAYSVLAPYAHEWSSAKDALRNVSVDLPLNANKAKSMASGTEVVLRGRGRIVGRVGVGVGKTLGSDFLSVGAHAGVSFGRSEELDLSVRVKRLSGSKVFVSLSRVDTAGSSASVGAHIGVDADSAEAIGDLSGGSWAKGGEILTKQIDKQLEKWLSADLRATHATSKVEKDVANYVIDLSSAAGREAYESLMKLDASKADQRVAEDGGFGPVRSAKLDETVRTASDTLKANIGPIKVLSSIDSASETHGSLTTADGTYLYDRAVLSDSYSGIISDNWNGKRSLTREFISFQRTDESKPTQYYHFDYSVKDDDVTSKNDVLQFLALGKLFGVVSEEVEAQVSSKAFMKKLDETDRFIDVYFSQDGLQQIAEATPDQIRGAFANAYQKIDRPGKWAKPGWETPPWVDAGQNKRDRAMKLLRKGPQPGSHHRSSSNSRDRQYQRITGRSLRQDYRAFRKLQKLEGLVQALKEAPTAAARTHVFAEAKDDLGLGNFWLGLGTIAQLADEEDVLVHRFALEDKDSKQTVTFASEGALRDPQSEINRALALGSV